MSPRSDPPPRAAARTFEEHADGPALQLAILGQVATNRLRAAHAAHGLTSRQFQVLGLLHDHGGLAQSDLARIMDTAPSMLVTLLNPLEAEGLVERRRDPADRRRHFVALTKAGEMRFMSASQAHAAAEEELFASLDDRQREQLRELLRALRDGLAPKAQGACRTEGPAR
jgi:DNA-binding MarR family transcriptional regulator